MRHEEQWDEVQPWILAWNYPLVGRWKTHLSPSPKTKRVNTKHHSFEGRGFQITWDITMVFKGFSTIISEISSRCRKWSQQANGTTGYTSENQELEFRLKKHILLEITFPKGRKAAQLKFWTWMIPGSRTCDEGWWYSSLASKITQVNLKLLQHLRCCPGCPRFLLGFLVIFHRVFRFTVFPGLLSAQTHSTHSWGAMGRLVGEMMESFTQDWCQNVYYCQFVRNLNSIYLS